MYYYFFTIFFYETILVYSIYEPPSSNHYGSMPACSSGTPISYEEVVLAEGYNNQHFKSLSDFIASASILQNEQSKKLNILQTPTKKASKTVPSSPNLDWLNAEVRPLWFFTNICTVMYDFL